MVGREHVDPAEPLTPLIVGDSHLPALLDPLPNYVGIALGRRGLEPKRVLLRRTDRLGGIILSGSHHGQNQQRGRQDCGHCDTP